MSSMNSGLKTVLTPAGAPNPPVTTQLNKPMHPQGTPATYGQPTTHMPQSLANLPHNSNVAHGHPNPAHQINHYSLNVPNAPQHYAPNNPSIIPASNHPVPNSINQSAPAAATYSPNKNATLSGAYQPNLGHPPNQNPIPPVSQTLPATQPPIVEANSEEKAPQSNGTSEVKSPTKSEENHTPLEAPSSPKPAEKEEEPKPSEPAKQPEEIKEPEVVAAVSSTEPPPAESAIASGSKDKVEEEVCEAEVKDAEPDGPATESAQTPSPKKEKAPAKGATPTQRSPTRKSKTPKSENDSPKTSKADTKLTTQKSPSLAAKSKRTRVPTQPYQSPLPEIEIITKISSSTPRNKNNDDKLIVFYKNEFLAVRNSEGSFYVCRAVQNIYKSSPKIRIRWLSQDKNDKSGEIYTPDFYDNTDFDCILTNLNLVRVDKGRFRLPAAEKERTDSILKRSLAVEKGEVTSPSLTEEHPDGIDLSLYKEESQLKKRKSRKRKGPGRLRLDTESSDDWPQSPKVRKVAKPVKKGVKRTVVPKKTVETKKTATSRTDRAKRRSDNQNHKVSTVVDEKKARVLAKVARKTVTTTKAPKATTSAKVQKAPSKTRQTKRSTRK